MARNVIHQLEQCLSAESLALVQKAGALAAERRLSPDTWTRMLTGNMLMASLPPERKLGP